LAGEITVHLRTLRYKKNTFYHRVLQKLIIFYIVTF